MATTPEKEAAMLRRELERLTVFVRAYVILLDQTMKGLEGVERGKRIADLSNKLQFKNDSVRRFVLNLDFNGRKLKRKPYVRSKAAATEQAVRSAKLTPQ